MIIIMYLNRLLFFYNHLIIFNNTVITCGAGSMSDKSPEMTEIKTMWSESLLEALYVALRKEKEDKLVKEVIDDLRAKEYDDEYIINKVKKKVCPNAAVRIEALLTGKTISKSIDEEGKPLSKADQARASAAKKRAKEGLVGKIKGIFGGS
jgi:hypothetical protein